MTMYLKGTWTCPSSNPGTSDKQWDLAMLTEEEYCDKYRLTPTKYRLLKDGEK